MTGRADRAGAAALGSAPVEPAAGGPWVFAYGSVMWRPGFAYLEARPALLRGYHRAFCVYSLHYRGTPEKPGLVLGLLPGGACKGLAFRIAQEDEAPVLAYLDGRENLYEVYCRKRVPVRAGRLRLLAHAYVANPRSPQYAGKLPEERIVARLRDGRGLNGSGLEYLENTVRHLEELGMPDKRLSALLVRARSAAP